MMPTGKILKRSFIFYSPWLSMQTVSKGIFKTYHYLVF
jgi:hypothetical protein